MGLWEMLMLSTSFSNPKLLSDCPFYYPHTTDTSNIDHTDNITHSSTDYSTENVAHPVPFIEHVPTVRGAIYSYLHCAKLALNTRVFSFHDPTLHQCIDHFNEELRAIKWIGNNTEALESFRKRKACKVNVNSLPWAPREEYKQWLRTQGRLDE